MNAVPRRHGKRDYQRAMMCSYPVGSEIVLVTTSDDGALTIWQTFKVVSPGRVALTASRVVASR